MISKELTRKTQSDAVKRAGIFSLLSLLLFGAAVATALIGSSHANKPHEVKLETLFFLLVGMNTLATIVAGLYLWCIWKWRSRAPSAVLSTWSRVVVVLAGSYTALALGLLVAWLLGELF